MAPASGHPSSIAHFAASWLQQLAGNLVDLYGAADFDDSSLPPPTGFRNCFGYDDSCVFALPAFSVGKIAPVLANILRVDLKFGHESGLNAQNRRDRLRQYVAEMHIAHIFAAVGENVWPDILDVAGVEHRQLVVKMPRGLQPMTYLRDAGRHKLDASNWQILECVSRLKGTKSSTAYHGYNVPGTWADSGYGNVLINNSATSCAALDACLRGIWLWGGSVDVESRIEGGFKPVRDVIGLIAPLGFAPIVHTGRRTGGVVIGPGVRGRDLLRLGNQSIDVVVSR